MTERAHPTSDYAFLGAILLVALVLRLVGLNGPLWYDELMTLATHLRLPWAETMHSYSMNHHYFFSLQSKLMMGLFGDAPWALRLPAMLFGLGSIAAIWWLARDVAGAFSAHLTGFLLAISYHHIWFSQNARGYTELAFWSTLGMIFFLRGLDRPRAGVWVGFGVTLALAVFTHLTGAFLYAAQGLVWLVLLAWRALSGRLDRAFVLWPLVGAVVGLGLAALLYAPLLPSVFSTVSGVSDTSAIDVMQEYQNPLWTIFEAMRTAIGGAGPVVALAAIGVIGLAGLGGFAARRTAPAFAPTVLLHIVLTMALLLVLGMRIWPRFFFVDIGFLMLLIVMGVRTVAVALASLSGGRIGAARLFGIAAALMVLVSGALAARNYTAPKQDLAGAYDLVESIRKPGERIYAAGVASEAFTLHFHADWMPLLEDDAYRAAMAQPGPVIVVAGFPGRTFRKLPSFDTDSETALTLVRRFPGTLGDGAVLVFRRD